PAVEAHFHPPVEQGWMASAEDPGVGGLPRVGARLPPAAALEDEHAHALLRQPARHDRAAEAAADHDDVEGSRHSRRWIDAPQRRMRSSRMRTYVSESFRSSR